jgi:prepilin-type N-terminal cleavage/methylation domain-containing protein
MKKHGFTLIELLCTLSVCAMLLFSASASWTAFKESNEQKVLIDEIKNAIHYATLKAMSDGQAMRLAPKELVLDWSKGMDLVALSTPNHEMHLVHTWTWRPHHWGIQWFGVHGSHYIDIQANTLKAMSNGRFVLTNKRTQEQIVLVLNRLGRIRVEQ